MPKKPIHTVPSPKGGWDNKEEKNPKPISHAPTKVEAIKLGREKAKEEKTEHIIHKKDGKIGDKNSYGNDPNPPKDKD